MSDKLRIAADKAGRVLEKAGNFKDKLANQDSLSGATNKKIKEKRDAFDENMKTVTQPNALFKHIVDYVLERSYLNAISDMESFDQTESKKRKRMSWVRLLRIPVSPGGEDGGALAARWQNALSTLHVWGHRLVFLIMRRDGETSIYLGACAQEGQGVLPKERITEQLKQAVHSGMPGVELEYIYSDDAVDEEITDPLELFDSIGAITGIPSLNTVMGVGAQTLDPLTYGIQDHNGLELDFAFLVVADPIGDSELASIISHIRNFGSSVHSHISASVSLSKDESFSTESNVSYGGELEIDLLPFLAEYKVEIEKGFSTSRGIDMDEGIEREYIDKTAGYAEELVDMHIGRLKKGRSLGFWNTGIYVFSHAEQDVETLMGMLRPVYSGDESYIEPIRAHKLKKTSGAQDIADRFCLIPLPYGDFGERWHIFGENYQYISTPLNTEELSIATALPKRDVPGLCFAKTAVRFLNGSKKPDGMDAVALGRIVDEGVLHKEQYFLPVDALSRHGILTGGEGTGKSSTAWEIIRGVLHRKIPALIIEPFKDEYVRKALEYNREHPDLPLNEQFAVYMPGVDNLHGEPLSSLQMNIFRPAAMPGSSVDVSVHLELVSALLSAIIPGSPPPYTVYEALSNYSAQNAHPYLAYLLSGKRGMLLNSDSPTACHSLFERPCVINLSHLTGATDRALCAAFLFITLYEYGASRYYGNQDAALGKLAHLTVLQEASLLFKKPHVFLGAESQANPVWMFADMLSEIAGFGQGMLLVEKMPELLIAEAIKNTNYRISHRIISRESVEIMSETLRLRGDQKGMLLSLEDGDALVYQTRDDAASWIRVGK